MGVIQKQAVRTTSFVMLGMVIGVLSRLAMPILLTKEQIGVLSLLDSVSNLLATIFCLGFIQVCISIFPRFRDEEKGHHGILVLGLAVSLVGIALGVATFILCDSWIFGSEGDSGLLRAFSFLIMPMIFWRIIFKNLDAYMRMLFSSVTGAFLEAFLLKAVILLSLISFYMGLLDFAGMVYVYVCAFCVPGIVIIVLSIHSTKKIVLPHKSIFLRENRKGLIDYSLFGLLASTSGILVLSIDQIMMVHMLSVEAVGLYSVFFFAAALINVPGRGLKRIAMPVLSEAWERNDIKEIQSVYQKSSIVNLTVSLFLFAVGWACLDHVLTYIPDYKEGVWIFFFIGIGQLVDMMTGVNMEIIATSEKYRLNTYFNLALAALVIVLNLVLIPRHGVIGSAMATGLALTLVNCFRWLYLKRRFGLQPFNMSSLKAILLATPIIIIASIDPLTFHPLVNIAVYTISFTLIFWTVALKASLSPDINDFVNKILKVVKPK